MKKPTQLDPYRMVFPAGNNIWHAIESIRKFGEARHAAAYVELLLERGDAKTVADALQQAAAEMADVDRQLSGVRLHKLAHQRLQEQERRIAPSQTRAQRLTA